VCCCILRHRAAVHYHVPSVRKPRSVLSCDLFY
jgi:hypothetical protein